MITSLLLTVRMMILVSVLAVPAVAVVTVMPVRVSVPVGVVTVRRNLVKDSFGPLIDIRAKNLRRIKLITFRK